MFGSIKFKHKSEQSTKVCFILIYSCICIQIRYNAWRRFCGLPYAIHFGTGIGGLIDHTEENIIKLRSVYRYVVVNKTEILRFSGKISTPYIVV